VSNRKISLLIRKYSVFPFSPPFVSSKTLTKPRRRARARPCAWRPPRPSSARPSSASYAAPSPPLHPNHRPPHLPQPTRSAPSPPPPSPPSSTGTTRLRSPPLPRTSSALPPQSMTPLRSSTATSLPLPRRSSGGMSEVPRTRGSSAGARLFSPQRWPRCSHSRSRTWQGELVKLNCFLPHFTSMCLVPVQYMAAWPAKFD
jgi:hypothetical protein